MVAWFPGGRKGLRATVRGPSPRSVAASHPLRIYESGAYDGGRASG